MANHSIILAWRIPMDKGAWWTSAYQVPPSMGFSRREYWSGVPKSSSHLFILSYPVNKRGFPGGSVVKNLPANEEDTSLIPGLGTSPGVEMATHSNILAWRISVDRGAWRAIVHRVTKNQTQLK